MLINIFKDLFSICHSSVYFDPFHRFHCKTRKSTTVDVTRDILVPAISNGQVTTLADFQTETMAFIG